MRRVWPALVWALAGALGERVGPAFDLTCLFGGEARPAQVVLDGRGLGSCPLRVEAGPGRHLLRLRLEEADGTYLAYEAPLEVVPGGPAALSAELLRYDPRAQGLQAGRGLVYALAFGPRGLLAAGSGEGLVHLFPPGGAPLVLKGHTKYVRDLAFSPDGTRLASGGGDGTVRLWDLGGRPLRTLGQGQGVWKVQWDAAGQRLFVLRLGGQLSLYEAASGRSLLSRSLTPYLFSAAFSPGGRVMALGLSVARVEIWESDPLRRRGEFKVPGGPVYAVAFSPDGRYLATGSADGSVKVYDLLAPGEPTPLLSYAHRDTVLGLAFSPDGRYLASSGQDREVRLLDLKAGRLDRVYVGHTGPVYGVEFHPTSPLLATSGAEGRVLLFNLP